MRMKCEPLSLMKNKFLLTVLLTFLSLVIPLTMQAKGKEPGNAGVVEFTCAAWDNLPYPELFYLHGGEHLPLVISAGLRSEVFTLKGAEILELFVRKDKDAGAGTSSAPLEYERVGMAPLMKGVKRMLFLIEAKNDANGLPLQILGMDDSAEAFPGGCFRFVNQTPDPLRIELAGATCELPAGALKVVTPEIPAAGGFLPVIIKDVQGRNLLENRLLAQRTGRELVIIHPPAEGRNELMMKFLSETIPVSPTSGKKRASRK